MGFLKNTIVIKGGSNCMISNAAQLHCTYGSSSHWLHKGLYFCASQWESRLRLYCLLSYVRQLLPPFCTDTDKTNLIKIT